MERTQSTGEQKRQLVRLEVFWSDWGAIEGQLGRVQVSDSASLSGALIYSIRGPEEHQRGIGVVGGLLGHIE